MLSCIWSGKLDANAADEDGIYPFFTCAVEPLLINIPAFDCKAVLVAGNGDLNVKYHEGKFNAYQRTYVIESIDTNELHPKFLYYFLSDYIVELRELSIGGVIKYIKLGNLTDAKIPLPPLAEQKRIAAILDKANEIKAKRELALAKLDDLAECTFREMFGDISSNPNKWDVVPLNAVSLKITDGEHLTPQRTTEGIKLLSARNIQDGYLSFDDVDYVGEDEYQRISNTMEASFCIACLEDALILYGKPEVFNSDQGAQFTSTAFTDFLKREAISISMDGRGRVFDNIFVERLWRSVKYEDIYLQSYSDAKELKHGLKKYFDFYNEERPHQALSDRTPQEVYESGQGGGALILQKYPVILKQEVDYGATLHSCNAVKA